MNTRAKALYNLFFNDPKSGRPSIENPSNWPTDAEINGVLPFLVIDGSPVNAVAASAVLTAAANVTAGKIVTIGDVSYTFRAALTSPAVPNEVLKGASASDSLDNLIAAINGDTGEGTKYSTGTVAHELVTAAAGAGDTMSVTAKTKGVAGNEIAKSTDDSGLDWDGTGETFTGGVNGTVGSKGEFRSDATYLYFCKAANTIADTNWRRITLGSSY